MMRFEDARKHLIVALDVPTREKALDLVDKLQDQVGYFKVGLQLYTACGPSVVEGILRRKGRVFLDLKLHDIPNTVSNAVVEAVNLGVDMLTIHTLGGPRMLESASNTVDKLQSNLQLLGVTILTSMDQPQIEQIGFDQTIENLVVRLSALAQSCGVHGVVCSPVELDRLSSEKLGDLFFVTPGIRPAGASLNDQARVKTPAQAIAQGARHLVVGRPITQAPDPAQTAAALVREIEAARI